MSTQTTLYDQLGVSSNATLDQIKKVYRQLALKWHPDKNIGNRAESLANFQVITFAYNVLSRKASRDEYDQQLLREKIRQYNRTNQFITWAMQQFEAMQEDGESGTSSPPMAKPKHQNKTDRIYKKIKKYLSS